MTDTLDLAKTLIEKPSVTPTDAGCQDILIEKLKAAGFTVEKLPFDEVQNFWAYHGEGETTIVFAGHTDVVPPGPLEAWDTDPFTPTEKDGFLYGRGAADMKSAVAAMVTAAINFVNKYPDHVGKVGLLITGDEEGPAINGTVKVVEYLNSKNIKLNYCVVGEASSNQRLGDAIKIGRRGSLHGNLVIKGKQGHIAYPKLADNPIHRCFAAFDEIAKTAWDEATADFPATSFQFYDIQSGVGASNVIPGSLTAKFNFRFSPVSTAASLKEKFEAILNQHALSYFINWNLSSKPYFSGHCHLATVCTEAIKSVCGVKTEPNTYGGTSDGRFIAPTGCEVIELGPVNESIHKANEHINVKELNQLTKVYQKILMLILRV